MVRHGYEILLRLIEPMTPHIAEELWERLGGEGMLRLVPWPSFDDELVADELVSIAVQVNGRLRGTIHAPRDSSEEDVRQSALEVSNVQRYLDGAEPRRVIVVPNRVVNLVV